MRANRVITESNVQYEYRDHETAWYVKAMYQGYFGESTQVSREAAKAEAREELQALLDAYWLPHRSSDTQPAPHDPPLRVSHPPER